MTEAIAPRPRPACMAVVTSQIMLPASGPTIVAPKIVSLLLGRQDADKAAVAVQNGPVHVLQVHLEDGIRRAPLLQVRLRARCCRGQHAVQADLC